MIWCLEFGPYTLYPTKSYTIYPTYPIQGLDLANAWQEKAIDEGMLDNIPMPRWRQVFLRHIADLSRDLRFRA